ncbi:hypothetical protein Tco_1015159 [Tanacetum coccineum]|uniref:Uncharacterized protein n=1 Tax=Tanacetum coccineum TaxID=301880 RepID=A0ABQ5FL27_9ASTR
MTFSSDSVMVLWIIRVAKSATSFGTLWLNPNRDEKSGITGREVVALVVDVGVGVDCCGRGMNGGIGEGIVVAVAVEVLGITITVSAGGTLSKFRN